MIKRLPLVFFLLAILVAVGTTANRQAFVEQAQPLVGTAIPSSLQFLLGDERIIIHIGDSDTDAWDASIVTEENVVVSIEEKIIPTPTLELFLSEETLGRILSSSNPVQAFLQEKDQGNVRFQGAGIGKKVKYSLASFFFHFFGNDEAHDEVKEDAKNPPLGQAKRRLTSAEPGIKRRLTSPGERQAVERQTISEPPARRLVSPEARRIIAPQELPSSASQDLEDYVIRTEEEAIARSAPAQPLPQRSASLEEHRCTSTADCRQGMACTEGYCVVPISEQENEEEENEQQTDEESSSTSSDGSFSIMDLLKSFLGGNPPEEAVTPSETEESLPEGSDICRQNGWYGDGRVCDTFCPQPDPDCDEPDALPKPEDTLADEPQDAPADAPADRPEDTPDNAPDDEPAELLCQTFADEPYPTDTAVPCTSAASTGRTLKIINDLEAWYGTSSAPILKNEVVWLMYAKVGNDVQYLFGGDALGLDCNVADGLPVLSPGQEMAFSLLDDAHPEEMLVYDIRPFLGTWDTPGRGRCWQRNVHDILDCDGNEMEKARSIRITQPPNTQAVIRLSRFFPDSSYDLEWC